MQDCYRSAASLLLLRPKDSTGGKQEYDVLLLHKPRKRDAWQLPQGGSENGENAERCAVRELREEAGISDVKILGTSHLVYQYNFPTSYRRFRPDHICGQRIAFVFGTCPADTVVTVDGVEVDDFQWIEASKIGQVVKRKEYVKLVMDLLQEAMSVLEA